MLVSNTRHQYVEGPQATSIHTIRNLKSLDCVTLLRGPLAAEYYYVYAMDERGGEWKGKAFMCTSDREFKIEGRQDCFVRGYDRTGFFEVDTGKEAKNWTVQLTDQTNR
jgi:uncharacterized membrane protein